jgi:hypothetical protein
MKLPNFSLVVDSNLVGEGNGPSSGSISICGQLMVALQKIANWGLPPSGKYWDLLETDPMSYEAAYGSNGVRDYR